MAKPDAIRELERELREVVNTTRPVDYSKGLTVREWCGVLKKKNTDNVKRQLETLVEAGGWISAVGHRNNKGNGNGVIFRPKDNKKWAMYLAAFKEAT